MFPIRSAVLAATLAVLPGGLPAGRAQDAPKDEALDDLLKQVETQQNDADAPGPRPPGAVAAEDQDLDNFLEKLGETKDAPDAAGRPGAPPADGPAPAGPGPDRHRDELTGEAKDLDEHLEELTGRKKRQPPQPGDPQDGGPLADVIEKMREVERRLSQPDTGEDTRKKQEEIVQALDSVLERVRAMKGQGQGRTLTVRVDRPRPGSRPNPGNPGAQPGGAPNQRPERPTNEHAPADAKDEWGHLPNDLKTEMDNVAQEKPLPKKQDLISRYYLSVAKKSLSREE
jgi:hypothetical protein